MSAENPLDELPPGISPAKTYTVDDWNRMRAEAAEKAQRLPLEEAARDEADTADFFASMAALASREVAAWAALPCLGELASVAKCSDDSAATCERRDHVMCPRRQLARAVEHEREAKAVKRAALKNRGAGERELVAVFDAEPLQTPAMAVLRAELAKMPAPVFVVLSGGVGCGKSCAATWWATRHDARIITAADFGKLSPFGDATPDIVRTPTLVLDDLGVEYLDPKGFFQANLDALLLYRDKEKLQTVITTNLKAREFGERYGARIGDRIMGAGVFKEVAGGSLRRRA